MSDDQAMLVSKACAFMSYVQDDDTPRRQLTRFSKDLSEEIEARTGEPFPIFQDRSSLEWGENWASRIENALDEATFLIAVLTPRFFRSEACRHEFIRFVEREKRLGREDLILPLYFIECEVLSNPDREEPAIREIARIIAARQYADWRRFRDIPPLSSGPRKALKELAGQVVSALRLRATHRANPTRPTSPARFQGAQVIPFPLRPIHTGTLPAESTYQYAKLVRALRDMRLEVSEWSLFAISAADILGELDRVRDSDGLEDSRLGDLIRDLAETLRHASSPGSSPVQLRAASMHAERVRRWIIDILEA